GESGSGKSVLSRSIMGLLPRSNVERDGSVLFEGKEIAGLSGTAMREYWGTEMAMVFQDPMTSLNPVVKIGRQITESLKYHLNLLREQQRERAMGMVLVTHDLGVVAGRADDIAVMYAGQVVETAPTRALFAQMRMPYTEGLLKSIPKLEQPSHSRLEIIGGRPPDLISPPLGCKFSPRCPYAQERCRAEEPPLIEAETPGHYFRCWFPVGTDAGREALERN